MIKKVSTVCLVCLIGLLLSAAVYAALYNRAPDVLPGTLPEMREPEFWIARMDNPDEVILSTEAIQRMNEEYKRKVSSPDPFRGVSKERIPLLDHWWPGFEMAIPDLSTMTPQAIADTVKVKIQKEIYYVKGMPFGNALAIEYADWEIAAFVDDIVPDILLLVGAVAVTPPVNTNPAPIVNVPVLFKRNGK